MPTTTIIFLLNLLNILKKKTKTKTPNAIRQDLQITNYMKKNMIIKNKEPG